MEENYKDEMIVIDNVNRYNEIFGLETKHPLVSIIDLTKSTTWPTRAWFRYEVYALFLKNVKCGDIILLHDSYLSSVQAALRIVDALQGKGYEFITVDQMISD